MNLTGYVNKFGKCSFLEKPFNNVDATILATAVYSNFEVIAPSINDVVNKGRKFKNIPSFDMTVVTAGKTLVKGNVKLLPAMKKSIRYGDIEILYVSKIFDEDNANQFYACTYLVPNVGTVVAFRGTDITVTGWEENLNLSIKEVIPSQLQATQYLNRIANEVEGPLYVVGHSKGGNLCLYASIYCRKTTQNRIVKSFSFDGNGLSNKTVYDSEEYKAIQDRFVLVKPYDAVVSELMYNPKKCVVVKSSGVGIFQHDTYTWKINKNTGDFEYTLCNAKDALIRHWTFKTWLSKTSDSDKTLLINFILSLLGGRKNTIFDFFFSFNKIKTFFSVRKQLTKEQRARIKLAFKSFMHCYKEAKIRYKIDGKEKQQKHHKQ